MSENNVENNVENVTENGNVSQPVQQKAGIGTMILKVFGIIMGVSVVISCLPAWFGGAFTADSEIIEAAEKKAKSIVVEATNEIPELETEILDQTDEWALVLVRYSCDISEVYSLEGCFIFDVKTTGYSTYVSAEYKESGDYDVELSEKDIEKIKAEWELE